MGSEYETWTNISWISLHEFFGRIFFEFSCWPKAFTRLGRGQGCLNQKALQKQFSLRCTKHKGPFDFGPKAICKKVQKECAVFSVNGGNSYLLISRRKSFKIWAKIRQTSILRHFTISAKSINSCEINKVGKGSFIYLPHIQKLQEH